MTTDIDKEEMRMKVFMGLDNGGTTTKAALYDERGNELGVASRETKMLTPRPRTQRPMKSTAARKTFMGPAT